MSPATHFLVSWVVASTGGLNSRERVAVTVAGIGADADALGLVAEELTRGWNRPLLWPLWLGGLSVLALGWWLWRTLKRREERKIL